MVIVPHRKKYTDERDNHTYAGWRRSVLSSHRTPLSSPQARHSTTHPLPNGNLPSTFAPSYSNQILLLSLLCRWRTLLLHGVKCLRPLPFSITFCWLLIVSHTPPHHLARPQSPPPTLRQNVLFSSKFEYYTRCKGCTLITPISQKHFFFIFNRN